MKHLKVFESFNDIDSICRKFKITNWKLNSDGNVDVDDHVKIMNGGLVEIPLKFGKVLGSFYCQDNRLISLEGAPTEVGGDFYCDGNQLDTLEGAPNKVVGDFYCTYNNLITLEGAPILVGGRFVCNDNPISQIYNLFPDHKSFMQSLDYGYLRGDKIIKFRFEEALDELEIKIPRRIFGYEYI